MEATRSISELKQYLDKFKEDMASIDIKHFEEIPKFSIPNWPKEAGEVTVTLWFRSLLIPVAGIESNLLNLKRKLFSKIVFQITEKGKIRVRLLTTDFDYNVWWRSDSDHTMERAWCFIMLSQFLEPVCNKIISQLKRRYTSYKLEAEEFNKICETVKKSFEPLIPFVVADILSEEGQ